MWAAIIKLPQTGWLKQQAFITHSSRVWKSKIKTPADSVFEDVLLPGSETASLSLCPRVAGLSTTPLTRLHPHGLVVSQRLHLQMPSRRVSGFQYVNSGEKQAFGP